MLEAKALGVRRGNTAILNNIDLALRPGELVGVIGPNGAGKSTLVKALCGLLTPSEGAVLLKGTPLNDVPSGDRARAIGYFAQESELAWDITVSELVGLGAAPMTLHLKPAAPDLQQRAAVSEAIAALSLGPLQHRTVKSLSGGERARAMLARALAGRPQILLADEPTAHLDLAHQADIMRHVRDETRTRGLAALVVAHDVNLAARFADRIVALEGGRIVLDAKAEKALADPILDRIYRQTFERLERAGRTLVMPS